MVEIVTKETGMTKETETQIASDEDLTRLFAGKPTQYRKSKSLPKFTGEAMRTCATINRIFFDDPDEAYRLFHELVPDAGEGVQFTPPFNVDYGIGLTIGRGTFLNKDFMVCGGGYVTLGEDCLIGPRCTIATPNHALDAATRLAGWEHASPVTIGDNVWFGANVTVTPGVTIGSNSIIGAGSVVTRDIPANSIAVGNPAHVIREIPERDPAFADVEGIV
ncbi:bacterial transferase hexapeptide repeat protein [Bifidobacterium pseudocatenulatum DSM 20438 = JCM 1200 = LMG 10505]|uniref:Acetyltransferase n=2 Tax=Bifidobacterium pseudocatenulatum TaxID=28026 RepID=C0BQ27_BIFPS|nr:bacterial transferase hexapeptide repeat protein [Bifidobacterium pseudocatenulatum DSM 20438 = JCM 1200 = LMG 10505]